MLGGSLERLLSVRFACWPKGVVMRAKGPYVEGRSAGRQAAEEDDERLADQLDRRAAHRAAAINQENKVLAPCDRWQGEPGDEGESQGGGVARGVLLDETSRLVEVLGADDEGEVGLKQIGALGQRHAGEARIRGPLVVRSEYSSERDLDRVRGGAGDARDGPGLLDVETDGEGVRGAAGDGRTVAVSLRPLSWKGEADLIPAFVVDQLLNEAEPDLDSLLGTDVAD